MNPELIERLHPPRLPEYFAQLGRADLLAAFGLGLLIALLVLSLTAPLLQRRAPRLSLPARIHAAATLPPQERLLALSRMLAEERGATLPEDLRQRLYQAEPAPSAAELAKAEALLRPGVLQPQLALRRLPRRRLR